MLYDNVNDANMRLAGSIVRLNGRAIIFVSVFIATTKDIL